MKLNELAKEIHDTSKNAGWWEGGDRNPLEVLMLITSELAEAAEEFRNNRPALYYLDSTGEEVSRFTPNTFPSLIKPEGWAVEVADAIIRCLDYTAQQGVDIQGIVELKMKYNKTRPRRHGGKKY